MSLIERAADVVDALHRLGSGFALVGGLAVSVRSRERFTRDVDFVLAVSSDAEAEGTVLELQRAGYRLLRVIEHEATGALAIARFAHPADRPGRDPSVDLVFASTGIESEIVAAATDIEVVPGLQVPVASTGHLIAMKVLSERIGRERDRDDLRALVDAVDEDGVAVARAAVSLIEERGFHRGKDLGAILESFLRRP